MDRTRSSKFICSIMITTIHHVENLKCSGCASSIQHKLIQLPGVAEVVVDVEEGLVRVEHDGTVEYGRVAEVLRNLGYPEQGTGGTMEKMKSYVSCAIGRVQG